MCIQFYFQPLIIIQLTAWIRQSFFLSCYFSPSIYDQSILLVKLIMYLELSKLSLYIFKSFCQVYSSRMFLLASGIGKMFKSLDGLTILILLALLISTCIMTLYCWPNLFWLVFVQIWQSYMYLSLSLLSCLLHILSLYPPQTLFVVGYTVFMLSVRACVCVCVRVCVRPSLTCFF